VVGNELGRWAVNGGGSGRRKMNPTSTVDAVDDGFKLRYHAILPKMMALGKHSHFGDVRRLF